MNRRPCPEVGRYRLTQRQADTLDTLIALPPSEAGWTVEAVAAEVGIKPQAARKRLELLARRQWAERLARRPTRYALTARGLDAIMTARQWRPGWFVYAHAIGRRYFVRPGAEVAPDVVAACL